MAATFWSNIHYLMFTLMFVSMLETRGLSLSPLSSVPGLAPSPLPGQQDDSEDIEQCWSPLENIQGCTQQIYASLFSSQCRIIRPACCKAITESSSICKPKLFPLNPVFPTLLESTCPRSRPAAATAMLSRLSADYSGIGLLPFSQPGQQLWQCFLSILNVQGCALQIYTALMTGQLQEIGPACCNAITQVTTDCWPKLLPFNPSLPQVLNSTCWLITGNGATPYAESKIPLTRQLPVQNSGRELAQCWPPLQGVKGCVEDIYVALSDGCIRHIGSPCCMAVSKITDTCWFQMFPLNPLFPPLLKSYCNSSGPAPAPDQSY